MKTLFTKPTTATSFRHTLCHKCHQLAALILLTLSTTASAQEKWIDVTPAYVKNPSFTNGSTDGWTISAKVGAQECEQGVLSFWSGTWDVKQSFALPNGHYRVSVKAFFSPGPHSNALVESYKTTDIPTQLYANTAKTPIVSVYSQSLKSNAVDGLWGYPEFTWGNWGGWRGYTDYYPDGIQSSAYCFGNGMYNNKLEVDVKTGTLTIGLKSDKSAMGDWTVLTGWKLEWYGEQTNLSAIEIPQSLDLVAGETYQLQPIYTPADATIKAVTYKTSNKAIATVDSDGNIQTIQPGTVTITATAIDGSGVTATCQLNIADNVEGRNSLIINEIQAANIDQFVDPSWNYGGWVELYNPTDKGVTLTGLWVSDDPDSLKMCRITQPMSVPAKGYLNLWFDHADRYCLSQVNFKLNVEGGTIYLSDAEGTLFNSQAYPEAISRCSYARRSLGSDEWAMTSQPTPEAPNSSTTWASERWEAPQPDKTGQYFGGSVSVKVSIPAGATLRYTTDGSTPTEQNGETSKSGQFTFNQTTPLRLCFVGGGKLPSKVVSRSFILDNVDVTLPIVSIMSDNMNFYDEQLGVLTRGTNGRPGNGQSMPCNWNMDWERPVNFEYMNEEGEFVINQEVALERCGGWSRAWTPYSFKLKANKMYELQNTFDYQFFSEKPYLKHKTLQLRNGGNDHTCRIKDAALQEIVMRSGLDIDCQAYQPVQHFINGLYAGLINVREPNNKHFVYANYGLDDKEIDMFEMSPDSGYVQKCGTTDAWKTLLTLSKTSSKSTTYEQIQQMIDIDEFCNYMAVEFYLCGTDWPQNNVKAYKPIMEGGKFRFILFDLDGAFSTDDPFNTFKNKQSYTFDKLYACDKDPFTTGTRYGKSIELVTLFLNMLKNSTFRKHFIDSFCIVAGSVFEETRCQEIIDELTERVSSPQGIPSDIYGQGSSPWSTAATLTEKLTQSRVATLSNNLRGFDALSLSALASQNVQLSSNLPEGKILVNDIPIPTNSFNGKLFPTIYFTAKAPSGYKFVGWKDTKTDTFVSTDERYKMPSNKASYLEAVFEPMSAQELADAGIRLTPIVINEVSAGNSVAVNDYFKKDDWVELYNTTDKAIDLKGMYLTDKSDKPMKYQITADGTKASTVIPAHGYKIIWCSKRDSNHELHANFKLDNEDGAMVRIMAADESWADSLVYCAHNGDQTVGRYPDGAQDTYLMTRPTIAKSNTITMYSTEWAAPDPTGIEQMAAEEANRNGALSLAYANGTLQIKSEEADNVVLCIYTPSGTLVSSQAVDIDESHHASIPVSLLTKGIYIARIANASGEQCSTKFYLK